MSQRNPGAQAPAPENAYVTVRLDWYRTIFAAILLFTVVTRFYGLANKPFHHDESLYATYSWYIHEGRGYTYDPMLHGPFMFYFDALLYLLFGVSDFVARSSVALFGIAFVCCVPLLRRELGKAGTLCAAALYAVSPTYMYFSRFFREDIFVAFWAFLSVGLFMNYLDTRRRGFLFGTAASLSFMFCVKENSYMFLFIYASFLAGARVFEHLVSCAASSEPSAGPASGGKRAPALDVLISAAIFFAVFYLFFSSFFANKSGFIDGLYRKSLGYWIHQDKIQRIKGPFTYFCPIALTYELPTVVILASGLAALLRRRRLSFIVLVAGSAISLPLMLLWHRELPTDPWDTRLHMTNTMHIVFALYVFAIGLAATFHYLRDGRRFPAFLAYWTWTSVLLYSYAGEKVPWLLMHVFIPVNLWAGLLLGEFIASERFRRRAGAWTALLAVGLLLFLQASLRLCFLNEANPVEIMVYTQTSTDIKKSLGIISRFAEESGEGFSFPLGVQGESTWPYTWYLRDYKDWFHPGAITSPGKKVVVVDWEKRKDYSNILEPNYREERLKLREWWVPEPVNRLKNPVRAWLEYYFGRKVWSILGSQDIAFYIRKDLVGEKMGTGAQEAGAPSRPAPAIPKEYATIGTVSPSLVFGERGSAKGRFDEPRGLWADEQGNIYVADTKNHRWQKFDRNGTPLVSVGGEGSGQGQFKEPMGIAVDADGNVYVADTWNHRIQKFDNQGAFLSQWQGGAGGFWAPKGMAFDSAGDLYVVDTGKHRVQKFSREGKSLLVWGDRGENPGEFSEPVGIAIERDGIISPADAAKGTGEVRGDVVYVADTANKRVQKFDAKGVYLGQFGVLGWEEYYTEPFIAIGAKNTIWLTDGYNNRVEIFDTKGTLRALWSAKGFRPGDFNIPKGIAMRGGHVYVSDTYNNRIQVFKEKAVLK